MTVRLGALRRLLIPLAALAILLTAAPPAMAAAPLPALTVPDCSVYAEPRVWLENHSWWIQKGEARPGRHIHWEGCFPLNPGGTLASPIVGRSMHLDATIRLHNRPGQIKWLRIQGWAAYDPAWQRSASQLGYGPCNADDCVYHSGIDVPWNGPTGMYEVRLTANLDPNVFNTRQFNTARFDVCVLTCSGGYSTRRTGAAGWYNGAYQNVYLSNADVARLAYGAPLTAPYVVHGIKCDHKCFAAIDENSHAGDPGIPLTISGGNVTIDPALLEPGYHKLFLRDEQTFTSGTHQGVSAGQYVMAFRVG